MEQRAPRIAAFSTTVASMSFIALLAMRSLEDILDKRDNVFFSNHCLKGLFQEKRTTIGHQPAGRRKNGFGSFFRYVSVCLQSGAAKIDPFQSCPSNVALLNKLRILNLV